MRSTDTAAPISSYVAPSGLRFHSYNDVVEARELHEALSGALIGAEAPYVRVRFALQPGAMTSASAVRSDGGPYESFAATSYVDYVSWLDSGDYTLTHEYGHAWSLYHAYIVQQDTTFSSYLRARGLAGDERINTSYGWSVRELIAEDYRQLFGSANARAVAPLNNQIPPAADVAGLAGFVLAVGARVGDRADRQRAGRARAQPADERRKAGRSRGGAVGSQGRRRAQGRARHLPRRGRSSRRGRSARHREHELQRRLNLGQRRGRRHRRPLPPSRMSQRSIMGRCSRRGRSPG